jgi:hypothetical protein
MQSAIRRGGGGRRDCSAFVWETTTVIVLGIILSASGVGFLCWLLFELAVYALPCCAGIAAGLAAFHSGAGIVGALLVGVIAGAVMLVGGQIAFAVVQHVSINQTRRCCSFCGGTFTLLLSD